VTNHAGGILGGISTGEDIVLRVAVKPPSSIPQNQQTVDLSGEEMIERELVLAKVDATAATRGDIMQIVNTFRAKIVDVNPKTLTIEVTGSESKVDAMLELLRPFGLREVVRTGLIALSRTKELVAPSKQQPAKSKASKAAAKEEVAK
jgi:acetolactate synthase-1/3 small subunit